MSDRSVITLQVGHYSNYIGAHFWNIQVIIFDLVSFRDSLFVIYYHAFKCKFYVLLCQHYRTYLRDKYFRNM